MKSFTSLLVLTGIVLMLGACANTQQRSNERVSIEIPSGWHLDKPFEIQYQYVSEGRLYLHTSRSKSERTEYCDIKISEAYEKTSLKKEKDKLIASFKQNRSDVSVLSQDRHSLNEHDGTRLLLAWTHNETGMRGYNYLFVKGRQTITVDCQARDSEFARHSQTFDKIVNQITFE
jgi:hypothetical protein